VRRLAALGLVLALVGGGCARGPGVRSRGVAKGILIALTAAAAGGAAGAAAIGNNKEKELRDDLAVGGITGREFADRDLEGRRWNRAARGAAFLGGLALVGLVVVTQMGISDRYQYGPPEQPLGPPIYPAGSPTAAGR
jgi:hypothetical protein